MGTRLVYYHNGLSSFVKKDLAILSSEYDIRSFEFKPKKKYLTPVIFLKQLFFIFLNTGKAKVCVIQFSGYHSLLPLIINKLFGIKTLIITGGTDCVGFPSIRYGNFSKAVLKLFTKWSYHLCDHISPVHETLILQDYTYQKEDFPQQGINFFCKNLKKPVTTIYNGYNASFWKIRPEIKRNPLQFITVAAGTHMSFTKKLKGIDLILEVAKDFPTCEFLIVGASPQTDLGEMSKNIIKIPFVPNEDLPTYYNGATYYLQLSISEGFPNALCEAMLCGCIPIISNVGGMPDIIRDCGYILEERSSSKLKNLIASALNNVNEFASAFNSHQAIAERFPEKKRKDQLLKLVSSLCS